MSHLKLVTLDDVVVFPGMPATLQADVAGEADGAGAVEGRPGAGARVLDLERLAGLARRPGDLVGGRRGRPPRSACRSVAGRPRAGPRTGSGRSCPSRRPARRGSPPRSRGRRPRRSARSGGSRPAPRGRSTASPGTVGVPDPVLAVVADREVRVEPGQARFEGLVGRGELRSRRVDAEHRQPVRGVLAGERRDERDRPDAAQLAELEEVDEQRGPGREALADRLLGADPGDPGREGRDRDVVAFGAHRARIAENAVHRSGHVGMLTFP